MNRNYPVSVGGSVRRSVSVKKAVSWMKAAFLAAAVLAAAGVVFYFGTAVHAADASGTQPAAQKAPSSKSLSRPLPKSYSLPMFFELNQGQTAPQVKFLARGSGYGLFLTADEAVLELQPSAVRPQPSALSSQTASPSVIRMRLAGANSSPRVSGASPLPGKSSYFIGNDPSKWRRDIPQFARVEYRSVYPGVDLVYYGNQGQLEYDFRVAPGSDPNQIALSFTGASARIVSGDSGDSGDLILSTANGDVRFRAPHVYQPAAPKSGNVEKTVAGSFRQLAGNKIGFTIGDYDHSRELVIDPALAYSTYLGGTGTQALVKVAVDPALNIYLAGSTTSTDFPVTNGSTLNNPQATNIFISKINPLATTVSSQLVYSIYLGSSGTDSLAGIAVDSDYDIYVAGTTASSDSSFPTTANAFQTLPEEVGTHGFLTKIVATQTQGNPITIVYGLGYSTYLSGNSADFVTGLAIDGGCNQQACNAYVTGNTTSTDPASHYFPANPNAYQLFSQATAGSGDPQFFASKINTNGSGQPSMLYSTYFGSGSPVGLIAAGGGIAVDPNSSSTVNMYITGTTNMLPTTGTGSVPILLDAWQSCLNQTGQTTGCSTTPSTNTDAIVAKFNPNVDGQSSLIYATYLGGAANDSGLAIAVDTTSNAYITGSTSSTSWPNTTSSFQPSGYGGGASDAFIAKIGTQSGSTFPLTYFTYLGGSGADVGNAILVDSVGAVHVVGSTTSTNFPTTEPLQSCTLPGDAFVALIATSGTVVGNYASCLGGSQLDQGTGVALDTFNATYVAGTTVSTNFPTSPVPYPPPYQGTLNGTSPNAFVSQLGASSQLILNNSTSSPTPLPVALGNQAEFTFDIINNGPDTASNVTVNAVVANVGQLSGPPKATVTGGTGNCDTAVGGSITCTIPTLVVCSTTPCTPATVEVDATPSVTGNLPEVDVSVNVSANNGPILASQEQKDPVVDFSITAYAQTPTINAGQTATIVVKFCPLTSQGYSGTITPSQTSLPSIVTSPSPTFNPTSVTLAGEGCGYTTLSIPTVARPVNTGSLLRRGSFYVTWLPIGGLSLVGLGIGASRKRRRWMIGVVLTMIAGAILLQSACGSSSNSTTTTTGTGAGTYNFTITGTAGGGDAHTAPVSLTVR